MQEALEPAKIIERTLRVFPICIICFYTLTTSTNTFTGDTGDDTFDSSLAGSAGTTNTLNALDKLDGGDGNDILSVEIRTAVTPASITNIETISSTFSGGVIFGMTGVTGLVNLANVSSSEAATYTGLPATAVNLSVVGIASDATLFTYASTTGTQSVNLEVSSVTGAALAEIQIDGIETIAVTASGTSVYELAADAATTLSFAGSADQTVTLDATTLSVSNYDGSAATGDITLTTIDQTGTASDVSVSGGSGDDTLTVSLESNDMSISGGAGDDTIVSTAVDLADTINGGDGTDTLYFATAATGTTDTTAIATTYASFSNIEKLSLRALDNAAAGSALDITVDMDTTEGVTSVTLSARDTETANAFTLNDLTAAQAAAISLSTFTSGVGATLNLDLADGSGAADVAKVTSTAVSTGSTITINDAGNAGAIEALEVTLSGAYTSALTIETAEFDDSVKISGGTAGIDVDGNGAALTSDVVDLSGFAGNINIALGANDQEVTGGTGNDTFEFGANLTRSDVVDGGAGTDVLQIMPAGSTSGTLSVTNVETLQVEGSASGSMNFSGVTSITKVDLDAGAGINGIVLTAQNLKGITSITATAETGGTLDDMNGLTITSGFTGTADALTLSLTAVADAVTVGALSLAGLESLTISATGDSDNDVSTVGGISATTGLTSVTVTDSGYTTDLTIQQIVLGTVGGNTTASMTTFDASTLVAGISVTLDDLASSASVTLGEGSDAVSIVGSTGTNIVIDGGDGNDAITLTSTDGHIITTGTGNATINLGTGDTNVITLGTGANDVNITDTSSIGNTISGFTSNDTISVNDDDVDNAINVSGSGSAIGIATITADVNVFTNNATVEDAVWNGSATTGVIATFTDVADAGDVEIFFEGLLSSGTADDDDGTTLAVINDGTNSYLYDITMLNGEVTALTLVGTVEGIVLTQVNFSLT